MLLIGALNTRLNKSTYYLIHERSEQITLVMLVLDSQNGQCKDGASCESWTSRCLNCNKVFKTELNMQKHLAKCPSKEYSCPRCDFRFKTIGALNFHKSRICGKKCRCLACDVVFESRSEYCDHRCTSNE